jgi:hypothetical protein
MARQANSDPRSAQAAFFGDFFFARKKVTPKRSTLKPQKISPNPMPSTKKKCINTQALRLIKNQLQTLISRA